MVDVCGAIKIKPPKYMINELIPHKGKSMRKTYSFICVLLLTIVYFIRAFFEKNSLSEQERKESVIAQSLSSEEGREALARALVEPRQTKGNDNGKH